MSKKFDDLSSGARAYTATVILCGAAVIAHSVYAMTIDPIGKRWVILAVLTLLTGSFNVKVPTLSVYISVSEVFVFTALLMFGTPAGTATVVLECLTVVLWMKRENRLLHRVLFNMAAPSVSVWIAGTAYYHLAAIRPYSEFLTPLPTLFLPLLLFTALYFLLNSWLVAIAVGLENQRSPSEIWWKNFAWLSVNYFSGASLAALIVTYTQQLDLSALAVIVPLLVVSYLTFRTAMGRVEDTYTHLSELNRLYLSTIETLAMAIDAKDQITHGHIRRVQTYAVGLAKRIGVTDDKLLKAIEAAALLHDMGKLAVPEHILNKPGKLTAAEFEKMKLHAGAGADILSAINFPYPVVPIVRHHHENWDGTGYPDGIRGTDIPIGARILSVVDCFDALTSDRPYRPRVPDEVAIAILLERRGSMYDPLVVDTFLRIHREIAPKDTDGPAPSESHRVRDRASNEKRESALGVLSTPAEAYTDGAVLFELSSALTGQRSVAGIGEAIVRHLSRVVPFSLAVVYLYDAESDELVAKHISGDAGKFLDEPRIARGEKLTGWVAANRQTIVNSDPVLDLGEIARLVKPPLSSTLSVPLTSGRELVGVFSLYSHLEFNDDHRRTLEAASKPIARSLQAVIIPIVVSA